MRLLITGGAGFIGSHFTRRQVNRNIWDSVVVLDALTYAGIRSNLAECENNSKFEFIHGNILDQKIVSDLMARTDVVVHFAAESHVDRSIENPHAFVETNVLGTQVLLKAARENKVETFIHVSTDEVYGSISEGSWPESHPVSPNSPYAASKAASDLLALSYFKTYGMDIRVTRCSNNYGPNQFPEKIIPLFITNLLQGKKLPLYGKGSQIRDWLHVEDHCLAIELVIANGNPGEIYNIGGGTELSNLELTTLILKKTNSLESEIDYVTDRLGHDARYSVNWDKASTKLNYTPRWTLDEGLVKTISWYVDNEKWWRPIKNA